MNSRRWIAVAVAVLTAAVGAVVIATSGGSKRGAAAVRGAPDQSAFQATNRPGTDGTGGFQGGFGRRPDGDGGFGGLDAAATYLGIDRSTLFTELQSGRTLAQIADATTGKSEAGLVAAMVAAQKARLAAAVDAGMLDESQAQQFEAGVEARVKAMVEGSFGGGPGFGGPPPGFDRGDDDGHDFGGGSDDDGSGGGSGGTGTFGGSGSGGTTTPPATTTTPSGTTL